MAEDPRARLASCIEAIESAYEVSLSYAAQGHLDEPSGADADSDVRGFLLAACGALEGLVGAVRSCLNDPDAGAWPGYLDILQDDADRARTTIALALEAGSLSSELVDNLNATSHVRAVLTDLFLVDSLIGRGGTNQ